LTAKLEFCYNPINLATAGVYPKNMMKNVTLKINEKTLIDARKYAKEHNMTLEDFIRKVIYDFIKSQSL
jgi:hypothetical protein